MTPDPSHDDDIQRYDLFAKAPDGLGNAAKSEFIRLLNQDRIHIQLLPDPNGERVIDQKTPTKWAILQILSKRVQIALVDIKALLLELGYRRQDTALRSALKRIVEFGFAVRLPFYRTKRIGWQLTERGRQLPLTPSKKNIMTLQQKVEDSLKSKVAWTFAADIATELQLDKKVVSSTLRKLYAKDKAVRKILAGYNSRLWAHQDNFNKGTLPTPPLPLPPLKAAPKKKKATSASAAVANQTSGTRNRSMCLPNKPTFVQAVTDIVNEKVASQASFSAHDITKALRDKVADPSSGVVIDVSETGNVFVGGVSVIRVSHDDVKEVVAHLFNTGALAGYDRSFNGTYLEYTKQNVVPAVDPSTPDPDPDPAPAPRVSTISDPYDGSSTI